MLKTLKYLSLLLCCFYEINADKKACAKLPGAAEPPTLSALRKKLKCKYDVDSPPNNATNSRVGVQIFMDRHRMIYYGTSQFLFSSSFFLLVWQDDRLKWTESEYKNRTNLYMKPSEIWTPLATAGYGYFRQPRYVLVFSSGQVNLLLWWEMAGHCNPSYGKWTDKRICKISFQLEPAENINLTANHFLLTSSTEDRATSWGIIGVKEEISNALKPSNGSDVTPATSKFDVNEGLISLELELIRNTAIMDATLFSPAAVLFLLLLASTWIPCGAPIRLAVLALATLLEIFLMYFATRAIPTLPGRFSDYAVLYGDMVLVSAGAFFEWYVAFIVASKKISSSGRLQSVAGSASQSSYAFLRSMLFIPSNPPKVGNGTPEGAFLSVILDRLAFIILLIVFVIIMVITAHRPNTVEI